MICGVIPARGGSRGLVGKNIKPFRGQPLICHTIEAGRRSAVLDRLIVSTDDAAIADVARASGAEVPFMRPADLARDDTPTLPVVQHLVHWLEERGERVEAVVILQPTSPLRDASWIVAAVEKFRETGADAVTTVTAAEENPYWLQRLEGERLHPFLPEGLAIGRRQDLPPLYKLNGAVYVTRRDVLLGEGRILGADTRALVRPRHQSIDIDDALEFRLAEFIAPLEV